MTRRLERQRTRALGLAAAVLALVAGTAAPTEGATPAAAYADARVLQTSLQQRGVIYAGRRLVVKQAFCAGLPQYGVLQKPLFRKEFRRFACALTGADRRGYRAEVAITGNVGGLAWRVVWIRRLG